MSPEQKRDGNETALLDKAFENWDFLESERGVARTSIYLNTPNETALARGSIKKSGRARSRFVKTRSANPRRHNRKEFDRNRRFYLTTGAVGLLILVLSLTFGWETKKTNRGEPAPEAPEVAKRVVKSASKPVETKSPDLTKQISEVPKTKVETVVKASETPKEANYETTRKDPNIRPLPAVKAATSPPKRVLAKKKIADIKIGDRVEGKNPLGTDGTSESIFLQCPHFVYSLELVREDGSISKVKLLRPDNWLETQETRLRDRAKDRVVDEIELIADRMIAPTLSATNLALDARIEMPEVGCVGWAELVGIDDSFVYSGGRGHIVSGTFEHIAEELLVLSIEDQEPITCTPNHPFWSVDRGEFVEAGELLEGERLQTFGGETKRVVQKLPRPGPVSVYNIEVFSEHVYRIAKDGLLVHNAYNEVLYHYTTKKGLAGILESKQLRPSLVSVNPKHSRFGDGQYFTDIVPGSMSIIGILKALIHVPYPKPKFAYFVKIDVSGLAIQKGREHVFFLHNTHNLDLTGRILSFGRTPD